MKLEIIPFSEYQEYYIESMRENSHVYKKAYNPDFLNSKESVGLLNNPFNIIQYTGREIFDKVLCFPTALKLSNGQLVSWTCPFNISDTTIRMRGIYVHPDYRKNGYARIMIDEALSLWPKGWNRCIVNAWHDKIEFYKKLGFTPVQLKRNAFGGPGKGDYSTATNETIIMERYFEN